jgi:hypothetical protein
MEPVAIPKPQEEYENDKLVGSELDHGGNPQLMEAQFLQLVSSIRALASSNLQLREALLETPHDVDFQSAIKENKYLILKKRSLLVNLVTDMKRMAVDIDVPDDIRDMVEERDETQYYGSPNEPSHVEHVDATATTTTTTTTTTNDANPTTTQEDAGVYL